MKPTDSIVMPPLKNMPLGEALVSQGLLSRQQLMSLKEEHQSSGKPFTKVLRERTSITDDQIGKTLAATLDLPFIDLDQREVPIELASRLSESLARRYRALVLEDRGGSYLVGMVNPSDLAAQDYLSAVLNRSLEIAVISSSHFATALYRVYSTTEQLREFARAVETDVASERNIQTLETAGVLSDADAPVIKLLQTIFKQAVQHKVSDIHIEPQEHKLLVRYRIDGVLQTRMESDLKIAPPLVVKLKLLADLEIAEKRLPQDGRISLSVEGRQLDIRMSTLPTQFGESIVLRVLAQDMSMRELSTLGMPPDILKSFLAAIESPNGIILATGPTGSGKTTTLYGALARLNTPGVKILTAEDPVEYRLAGANQVHINEKIGLTFPAVLRSFLRQDPDIILVGEIRDSDTAEIATRAAMTGHLVLSTLHTNDAVGAPSRLMDLGVPGFLVATTLRAVLSQRLLRLVCVRCAEPYELKPEESDLIRALFDEIPQNAKFMHGMGCRHCDHQGYRGRIGAYELLEMSRPLADALNHGSTSDFETVARQQIGSKSLVHQGLRLAFEGKTTVAEAIKHTFSGD